VIGGLIAAVGGVAKSRSSSEVEEVSVSEGGVAGVGASHRDVVMILVALPVYLLAVTWVGFFVSTFVFAAGLMVWLGSRVWAAGILSLSMLVVIYFVFVRMFDVLLPEGIWF
jgi:hypothetical protein